MMKENYENANQDCICMYVCVCECVYVINYLILK